MASRLCISGTTLGVGRRSGNVSSLGANTFGVCAVGFIRCPEACYLMSGLFTTASVAHLVRLCGCSQDQRLRHFLDFS